MCEVHEGGKLFATFHIKSHLGLGRSLEHSSVDLRELYVYKVLEHIKVGPIVHFIPNEHYSTHGLYIATQDGEYLNFLTFSLFFRDFFCIYQFFAFK